MRACCKNNIWFNSIIEIVRTTLQDSKERKDEVKTTINLFDSSHFTILLPSRRKQANHDGCLLNKRETACAYLKGKTNAYRNIRFETIVLSCTLYVPLLKQSLSCLCICINIIIIIMVVCRFNIICRVTFPEWYNYFIEC